MKNSSTLLTFAIPLLVGSLLILFFPGAAPFICLLLTLLVSTCFWLLARMWLAIYVKDRFINALKVETLTAVPGGDMHVTFSIVSSQINDAKNAEAVRNELNKMTNVPKNI